MCIRDRAYEHARKHSDADWLAFFDADEFLVLHQDVSIGAFLHRFEADVSAVAVNWIVFGSGGQEAWRALPVTERFTDALPAGAAELLQPRSQRAQPFWPGPEATQSSSSRRSSPAEAASRPCNR